MPDMQQLLFSPLYILTIYIASFFVNLLIFITEFKSGENVPSIRTAFSPHSRFIPPFCQKQGMIFANAIYTRKCFTNSAIAAVSCTPPVSKAECIASCASPISAEGMDTCAVEMLPSVEPPKMSARFAKFCTGI